MQKNIWVYWENKKGVKEEPAYITLCRWTMLYQWQDASIIFVNDKNVEMYLPGISKKVRAIEVDVKGRIDKFKRKFVQNDRNLAVKSDVIRAHLLKQFGGIYVDAGVIALQSLERYFEVLVNTEKSFIVSQRDSYGKDHYPVNFYGSLKQTPIINKYCEKISDLLKEKECFHYNELGASSLTPIVNEHIELAHVIKEKSIQPISFEKAGDMYSSTALNIQSFIREDVLLFKLFSRPFKEEFNSYSIEALYNADTLIGEIFRTALPKVKFDEFLAEKRQ